MSHVGNQGWRFDLPSKVCVCAKFGFDGATVMVIRVGPEVKRRDGQTDGQPLEVFWLKTVKAESYKCDQLQCFVPQVGSSHFSVS